MSTNAEHQVDDACQNDEPGNGHVDRHGGQKWPADRDHAEDDQQNTPHTTDNVEACRTMSAGLCCAIETS